MAKYRMFVLSEALPGREDAYSNWCKERHFDEMMRVPGVVSAERFERLDTAAGQPGKYVAIFTLDAEPTAVMEEIKARNGGPEMSTSEDYNKQNVQVFFAEVIGTWN